MARTTVGRLTISGDLVAQTPLHIGGHGEDADTDLPLARNGDGKFYVPGTSLAGAFRAWCEAALGEHPTREVWGYQNDDEGCASFVVVEDSMIGNLGEVSVETRDNVGIDREWGCAAEQIKYDRAVLPRGTRLQLNMTVEFPEGQRERVVNMFGTLMGELEDQELQIGAAKTRGLGRLKLENAKMREFRLNTPRGILDLLRHRLRELGQADAEPGAEEVPRPLPQVLPRPQLRLEIKWKPLGPLMVKAGADGVGVDSVPLVSGVDGYVTLVLPGSSIKGAIRSHAERILRTLLGTPLPSEADPKKRFLRQLEEVPLVEALFGAAGKERQDESEDEGWDGEVSRLGLGALGADDCYGLPRVTRAQWQAVVSGGTDATTDQPDSPLRRALEQAGLSSWTPAFHVAVDRWTGGAAERLLYTVLEPLGVAWEPLRLTVDLTRLLASEQLPALGLLLLTLRDVAEGRVPLGFATHRGMGAVEIETIRCRGRDLASASLIEWTDTELKHGKFADLPEVVRDRLNSAWEDWLTSQSVEVRA